ncbi:hypothetical protein AB0425_37630 [Actinosynnema sp. NPDC051121]
MATPYAVRRGGSVLLRTLAVGGFAAAAWFVCTGVASAGEDHSDEVTKTLDAVNAAYGGPEVAEVDRLVADAVPRKVGPFAVVTHEAQPIESTQSFESFEPFTAVELFSVDLAAATAVDPAPLAVMSDQAAAESYRYPDAYSDAYTDPGYYPDSDASSDTGGQSYSGYGYSSGYSHSGAVSNTMPAPLYEAKVAAKAAAREAAVQAAAPVSPAVTVTTPATADVQPFAPITSASPVASQATPDTEVTWDAPEPSSPAPAPKQAPAPSAPTASSGSADSGGSQRGGQLASLTAECHPKPSAAWSAERRDDGRSPGSVPGLPSTSPD